VIKKLIKLAVFLLIANAVYRVAPVWLHYYTFKDAVRELALFSREKSDAIVIDKVMTIAREHGIPLTREYVQVRRANDRLLIDATYVEAVKIVPGYKYDWRFDIGVTGVR